MTGSELPHTRKDESGFPDDKPVPGSQEYITMLTEVFRAANRLPDGGGYSRQGVTSSGDSMRYTDQPEGWATICAFFDSEKRRQEDIEGVLIKPNQNLRTPRFDRYFEKREAELLIGNDQKRDFGRYDSRVSEVRDLRSRQRESLKKAYLRILMDFSGGQKWFQAYLWESIKRAGEFDPDTCCFEARQADTTALFPELSYTVLKKLQAHLSGYDKPTVDTLMDFVETHNFNELYGQLLREELDLNPWRHVSLAPQTRIEMLAGAYRRISAAKDSKDAQLTPEEVYCAQFPTETEYHNNLVEALLGSRPNASISDNVAFVLDGGVVSAEELADQLIQWQPWYMAESLTVFRERGVDMSPLEFLQKVFDDPEHTPGSSASRWTVNKLVYSGVEARAIADLCMDNGRLREVVESLALIGTDIDTQRLLTMCESSGLERGFLHFIIDGHIQKGAEITINLADVIHTLLTKEYDIPLYGIDIVVENRGELLKMGFTEGLGLEELVKTVSEIYKSNKKRAGYAGYLLRTLIHQESFRAVIPDTIYSEVVREILKLGEE